MDTNSPTSGALVEIPQPLEIQYSDYRNKFVYETAAKIFANINFDSSTKTIRENAELCKSRAELLANILEIT